ncbi:MAG: hypothetical protein H6698_02820 [Myxococcales bacterium]|nr:hypothetical protein [Myxococcales bacterium]MCB9533247.1 hypothetical protein [Myxococcales bacterium]
MTQQTSTTPGQTPPPPASRGRWAVAVVATVALTEAAVAMFVGAVDRWATPSEIGLDLLRGGAVAAAAALAALAAVRVRGIARPARAGSAAAALTVVAIGVWPFATFATFIGWRTAVANVQRASCDAGDRDACRVLAVRKARRGHTDEAHDLFHAGCVLGDPFCCTTLAIQTPDATDAEREQWLRVGCDGGLPNACVHLARRLRDGDPTTADSLLDRACQAGDPSACDERALSAPRR